MTTRKQTSILQQTEEQMDHNNNNNNNDNKLNQELDNMDINQPNEDEEVDFETYTVELLQNLQLQMEVIQKTQDHILKTVDDVNLEISKINTWNIKNMSSILSSIESIRFTGSNHNSYRRY